MMRSPSVLATSFASSTICAPRRSACAMISWTWSLASAIISLVRFAAASRSSRPRSAAARPSAMVFCRASMARVSGGQIKRAQNQMKAANVTACASSVTLMMIALPLPGMLPARLASPAETCEERIASRKPQRQTDTDDERRVDQAEQEEHLRLQLRHELRLARSAFQEAAAHDADADAGASRAQADHQAYAHTGVRLHHRYDLEFVHLLLLFGDGLRPDGRVSDFRAPSRRRRW